jgi:hypothetical protein
MTVSSARYFRSLKTLDTFVDRSLELPFKGPTLSGFHYNRDLLKSAVAKTYLETVGNRADSIHLAIKQVPISNIVWEFRNTVEHLGTRFDLKTKNVVLAFDYTNEDFYGDPKGMWIYGAPGEHGVTGKFKFLSCFIVNSDIPQRIPLLSVPVKLGHNMATTVSWCIGLIEPLVNAVDLTIFDRGFYSKDLMLTLAHSEYPYLIFVPRNPQIKSEIESMQVGEKKKILYDYTVNKEKTVFKGKTTLAFLKQIFDKKSEKFYDWAFATNQSAIDLDYIIPTYKKRWRIETGFRVQDEARISSKSIDPRIRFFFFAYEQILQLLWVVLYKEEVSFKQFLLEMYELCAARYKEP